MDLDGRIAALAPLLGAWRIEAPGMPLDPAVADAARMEIEPALGGAFLLQRSSVPVEGAPDGLSVLAADHDGRGYTQHYFDSRGIVRLYGLAFDGRTWTLERRAPDFTPLQFHQRWTSTLSDDGATIEGRWETSPDGEAWELDFALVYRRIG